MHGAERRRERGARHPGKRARRVRRMRAESTAAAGAHRSAANFCDVVALDLPDVRIATTYFAWDACAVCGRAWDNARPVPTAYVEATVGADDVPPVPVCDFCVEEHYPWLMPTLLAARRRFHRT